MFTIIAPYPELYVTINLPDPEFGDSIGKDVILNSKYTMTGKLYTHKKTNNCEKMIFEFILNRGRSAALIEFVKSYLGSKIKIYDHTGKVWLGYFITDPIPFEINTGELVSVNIEFEGVQV